MRYLRAFGSVVATVGVLACGGPAEKAPPSTPPAGGGALLSVYVVNYPLAYLAGRIGGGDAAVTFPAPRGVDPAYWSPDPETVAAYQGADLILLNGASYARWVGQASLPGEKVVDTGAAYADRLIQLEEVVTHAHGPEGEHAHVGTAFTTWLDPALAREQARAIAAAFEKARPAKAEAFRERLALLEADLEALDTRLQAAAAALGDRPVLFSHPVYQYFQARYGLNGRSVHWEPDAEPSARDWTALEKTLKEHPARWMIWEAEPLPAVAARLRALGVESVVFDPCARTPEQGDFLTVMRSNAERIESAWATTARRQ